MAPRRYRAAKRRIGALTRPRTYKRAYKRKYAKYTGRRNRIVRSVPLPAVMKAFQPVTFNTCDLVPLTSGTGEFTALQALRPNNLLDPWGGASSVIQPVGLDQWVNFYNRYRVTDVYVHMKFAKAFGAAAQNMDAAFGYRVDQASVIDVTTTFQEVCNVPRTKWKYMPAESAETKTQTVSMSTHVKPDLLFKGVDKRTNLDVVFPTTAPLLQPILTIFAMNVDETAIANSLNVCNVMVHMTIKGFFYDRKLLPESQI